MSRWLSKSAQRVDGSSAPALGRHRTRHASSPHQKPLSQGRISLVRATWREVNQQGQRGSVTPLSSHCHPIVTSSSPHCLLIVTPLSPHCHLIVTPLSPHCLLIVSSLSPVAFSWLYRCLRRSLFVVRTRKWRRCHRKSPNCSNGACHPSHPTSSSTPSPDQASEPPKVSPSSRLLVVDTVRYYILFFIFIFSGTQCYILVSLLFF